MKSFSLAILIALVFMGFQEMKYIKTKVNDNISILLPEGFRLLDKSEIDRKYVAAKAPMAAYTDNMSGSIDIGVNVAFSQWNPEDLEIMRSFYKSTIMGLYDEVQFITEEVFEIDGRSFATFEFVSVVKDDAGTSMSEGATSKYTRIHYGIINHKTLLLNFTCPAIQKNKWAPVAKQVLESVKIGKTL